MKRLIYSICLMIFMINLTTAQIWDNNTTWVFETDEFGPPIEGNYLAYKIYNDTVISGEHFFSIQQFYTDEETDTLVQNMNFDKHLKYDDNRVYLYEPMDGTVNLIYDFNLEQGDSYMAYCDLDKDHFLVNIDSTEIIIYNGMERKIQHVSSNYQSSCYLVGTVIEGMGFSEHLFPRYTIVDPAPGGYIACYEDITLVYPPNANCSLILTTEETPSNEIKLYPNPCKDLIYVEGLNNNSFELVNTIGQTVIKAKVKNNQIDMSSLNDGIYYLIMNDQGIKYSRKIVKINR